MTAILPITGTFLDEITYDIPAQNWGRREWIKEFDIFADIRIDTVIIIRGGWGRRGVYPSRVIGNADDPDLAGLFLEQATRHGIRLFFGLYDAGFVYKGDWETELDLNVRFMHETLGRYREYPALHGWYIPHETSLFTPHFGALYQRLSLYLKEHTPDMPVLVSPYYPSGIVHGGDMTMLKSAEEFRDDWARMFERYQSIDICAFQDATCLPDQLPEYLRAIRQVCDEAGVECWNNCESFARNMPIKFPPADYRLLLERLRVTSPFVTKQITFEFSHFMSPQSSYRSAYHLFNRYCEHVLGRGSNEAARWDD
ncbi:MAG: DUF4434 domain-containing protein [Candidatus Sumerlaeia bacterium]